MQKKLLCQKHSIFYFISVWAKRIKRYVSWYFDKKSYCQRFSQEKLPFRVKKHQSVLIRKLGEADMQLQYNKVKNLSLAIQHLDGLLIHPGETFSFYRLVGLPTKRKGYLPGMELSRGEARTGIGGGICQIANLIHWLVIHSPLTVTERYHHGFDPFPDEGRVLPFGSGATVFYNYRDYQFANHTPYQFQLRLWLTDRLIEGEIRINQKLPYFYHVYEKHHQFLKMGQTYYRQNEIWREKRDREGKNLTLADELVTKNFAEVKYVPSEFTHLDPGNLESTSSFGVPHEAAPIVCGKPKAA